MCINLLFLVLYAFIMACNCKNKLKTLEKYSDDTVENDNDNIFYKIIQFFMQIGFGILVGLILIIMMIPFLLYLTFCVMFRIEPSFKFINFNKKNKDNNGRK